MATMIGSMLDWVLQKKMGAMHFRGQAPGAPERTRAILGAFVDAARACYRGASLEEMRELEAEVPWYRRTFFWEGYAFGLAGSHAMRLRRGIPDRDRIIDTYRVMHYTGYGFWNGLAEQYHLPAISLDPTRWTEVEDYARLAPLIAGGRAFAVVTNAERMGPKQLRRLRGRDGKLVPGATHGCGRALWFLYMENIPRLEEVVDAHPELATELLEGLGVAIGYTNADDFARVLELIESFRPERQGHLVRGTGICLQALIDDDPRNAPQVEGIVQERLRAAHAHCQAVAQTAPQDEGWYAAAIAGAREASL